MARSEYKLRTGFHTIDAALEPIRNEQPDPLPTAVQIRVKDPTLKRQGWQQREPASHRDLEKADNIDSYFSQTLNKYVETIWLRGYILDGDNQEAVKYLTARLKGIEMSIQQPIFNLWLSISRNLVHFGEAFIVKARARTHKTPPVPGLFTRGIYDRTPVIGLFEMEPSTVEVVKDEKGNLKLYRQHVGGEAKDFPPAQVIHLTYRRRCGFVRGRSYLTTVLGDLNSFRIMEDQLALLVQKHLFPLTLYRVGVGRQRRIPDSEMRSAISNLRDMRPDGILVVQGDHEIQSTGAESKAIRAEGYMRTFQDRLFAGLNMSDVQFGIGRTTNRNAGELISSEVQSRALHFQQIIIESFYFYLFMELLQEGGFDPINNPEDEVKIYFNPISPEDQRKQESQLIQLWLNNAITYEEFRRKLKLPIPENINELKGTKFELIDIPLAKLKAKLSQDPNQGDGTTANQVEPQNQYTDKNFDDVHSQLNILLSQVTDLQDMFLSLTPQD